MPMRSELPAVTVRTCDPEPVAEPLWSSVVAVVSDHDLQAVATFAVIGLLLTMNVVVRFPDFGQAFAALAVFP